MIENQDAVVRGAAARLLAADLRGAERYALSVGVRRTPAELRQQASATPGHRTELRPAADREASVR
ncbi:hypothetical protein GXW82_34680 [Streptacidiphilus sp. 4-A2]|nr:hypothetical protein [Streptacidiphilus sp. 4-A2]